MATHYLKCESEYYKAIFSGKKKFEIRENDRNFQIGDEIVLQEVINGEYTGNKLTGIRIQYILYGPKYGLPDRYCIFNW
jgi:hypothetical protein